MPRTAAGRAAVVGVLLVVSASVFLGELASDERPHAALLVIDGVVALVACVAAPRLSTRPTAAAAIFVGLTAFVPTVTPVAATSVLWLAQRRPLRVAVAAAVGGVAAQVLRGIWRPLADVPLGWWTLVVCVGYAAAVGWGAWMQATQALLASLGERARRAEEEQLVKVQEARRAERSRIAREMHDVLAHRLSMLAMAAGALEYNPDAPPADLARSSAVIRSTAHLALEELREVIGVLRTDELDDATGRLRPQPTLRDVAGLIEERRRTGAAISVSESIPPDDVEAAPVALGRTVYRIVQEALTNAAKHAPHEPVQVTLAGGEGEGLTVGIVNRMPAETPPSLPGSGTGLVGLAERVDLLGGSFEAGVTPEREHRVAATLPWSA